MNDDVSGWPSALLGEVYAKLTGRTVAVDEADATGVVPTITRVDDRGRYVLVTVRVPRSTSRVEADSLTVDREALLAEVHDRERIRLEE